jgi:predicted 3-demethylubiquinone-9 3-methyltransferase (glyoxalase superfamily)
MSSQTSNIAICLWFNKEAEEAANFYKTIFTDFEMGSINRYGKEGFEFHQMPEGTALVVSFKLNGIKFQALNGGPTFKFTEAVSIVIPCSNQNEIDNYWEQLTVEGQPGQCGWLKDKFGLSWQIVPSILSELLSGNDAERSGRVMGAFMQMQKFDIEKLLAAYNGY